MVSKCTESSSSKLKKSGGEQANDASWTIVSRISQLKRQIQASRFASIKDKLERNGKNLEVHTSQLFKAAVSKKDLCSTECHGTTNMLSHRIETALYKLSAFVPGSGDKENVTCQEVLSSTIVFGNNTDGDGLICFIKLPYIEKIPPYTTWIFLSRNQRMAEDQSVVGRRQIYYDQYGSEALICSDSEEEFIEPVDEKHEFSEGEDQILWEVLQEFGLNQEVLNILCQSVSASSSEIQVFLPFPVSEKTRDLRFWLDRSAERYETLMVKYQEKNVKDNGNSGEMGSERGIFLDKGLCAALDSFDNLFCRRCLVFDCRLHGCSQNIVIPSERQSFGCDFEENGNPCSDQCYLRGRNGLQDLHYDMSNSSTKLGDDDLALLEKGGCPSSSKFEDSNPNNDIEDLRAFDGSSIVFKKPGDVNFETTDVLTPASPGSLDTEAMPPAVPPAENVGKCKELKRRNMPLGNSTPGDENFLVSSVKKQKKGTISDVASLVPENLVDADPISIADSKYPGSMAPSRNLQNKPEDAQNESNENHTKKNSCPAGFVSENSDNITEDSNNNEILVQKHSSNSQKEQEVAIHGCVWSPLEKELYLKGIEIFGKNSCLIARNLLSGLKTCKEVANYMFDHGAAIPHRSSVLTNSDSEDNEKADPDEMYDIDISSSSHHDLMEAKEQEMPKRARFWRRRGKTRKLKYTWKSTGHPSSRKRIADGKQQSCKQYTPCGCQVMCGKQCPCLHNGTCCEKYCGCSKSCKNRFRGCHCAKSQCRSRQCPCFAAARECDPDVCRNCWVSCGDGSLGEPQLRGDGYQCGNMKLLLKQQQRILLGKSNVAGWGAFIKNPVNKNDYLGEYTGELISHKEADKRGKIYDRANSSFLFDLNDQYVLDAYRKGDKLKFANHSSSPNCYAKVMLVAGDHRVGIYAKEHIEASEELFYDYRYGPDQAPVWARKPEGSKRDDSSISYSRAQKIA